MREKVIKIKTISKNKQYIGLKVSSVEIRTAHSRDRSYAIASLLASERAAAYANV